MAAVGFLASSPAWLLCRVVEQSSQEAQAPALLVLLAIMGCGNAMALTCIMTEFSSLSGRAYLDSFAKFITSVAAAIALGPVFGPLYSLGGWSLTTTVGGVLCALLGMASWFGTGNGAIRKLWSGRVRHR